MGASPGALAFDLSGFGIRLAGLSGKLAERLASEWGPFVAERLPEAAVDFECEVAGESPDEAPFTARAMAGEFETGLATYRMSEGGVAVPEDGAARLRIESTSAEKQFLTLMNLACAAVAWKLPDRGGAMLHAAGIVLDGRGFVLVGPEGCGKTTWSLLAKGAGALLLSDDVVVVERGAGGGFEVLGTPFRNRPYGEPLRGRWPVAAILMPQWGSPARLSPAHGLRVRARLLANLPFVTEAASIDDRPGRIVEALTSSCPARVLTFGLDPGFVPLLASFRA